MAFPRNLDPSIPANVETPSLGASRIREKTQDFIDLFQLPVATNITAALTINRLGPFTNKTGVTLNAGDVVALSAVDDQSVVLADTQTAFLPFVVALATILNNQPGVFGQVGQTTVLVQGAVARGNYLRKSATTKALEDTGIAQAAGTALPAGALGVALTGAAGPGSGTVVAFLFGLTPTVPTQVGGYFVRGLVGTNNAGTPNTKWDMAADLGQLRNPTSGAIAVFTNTGTITNDLTLDNTNANGRDQVGAFGASNWIHFYWVRTTGGLIRTRSSLTAPPTGPALPAGEDSWAYAGAVRFDGSSHLIPTYFRGAWAYYQARQEFLVLTSITLDGVEKTVGIGTVAPPNSLATQQLWYFFTRGDFGFKIRVTTGADFYAPPAGVGVDTPTDFYVTMIFPYVATNMIYLYANIGGTANVAASMQGYEMPNGGE